MKRLIYIGKQNSRPSNGGEICCFNNQIILKTIFGSAFKKITLKEEGKLEILFNKLFFLYPGLQLKEFKNISRDVKCSNPNYIFIETAQYGALVKFLKKKCPECKIITFFHNIELQYAKSYFSLRNPKSWYFYILTKLNEFKSIRYSDYKFVINKKDSDLMNAMYGITPNAIMPFSVENKISEKSYASILAENERIVAKNALFVGSNFFGNTEGLNWFIKEVLPNVDIHLTIVGSGMSSAFSSSSKITVYDFVEDLSKFYREADFVVLPIISGGGMKTKMADAMMWGKVVLGTSNAFCGYEVENCRGIYCCNTSYEYINTIQKLPQEQFEYFNENIHQRFLQFHSIQSTVEDIKLFFTNEEKTC